MECPHTTTPSWEPCKCLEDSWNKIQVPSTPPETAQRSEVLSARLGPQAAAVPGGCEQAQRTHPVEVKGRSYKFVQGQVFDRCPDHRSNANRHENLRRGVPKQRCPYGSRTVVLPAMFRLMVQEHPNPTTDRPVCPPACTRRPRLTGRQLLITPNHFPHIDLRRLSCLSVNQGRHRVLLTLSHPDSARCLSESNDSARLLSLSLFNSN